MKLLAALLLVSCNALQPDYLEASPWFADGSASGRYANMPAFSSDDEQIGLMFTVGWFVGETGAAMSNLARLDVSKAGQLTMRDQPEAGGPVTVNVEKDDAPEPEPEPGEDGRFTRPPETKDELLIWLGWIAGLTFALVVAAKTGILKLFVGLAFGRRAAAELTEPEPEPSKEDKPKPDIKDYPA
jgi:hypothetical protein